VPPPALAAKTWCVALAREPATRPRQQLHLNHMDVVGVSSTEDSKPDLDPPPVRTGGPAGGNLRGHRSCPCACAATGRFRKIPVGNQRTTDHKLIVREVDPISQTIAIFYLQRSVTKMGRQFERSDTPLGRRIEEWVQAQPVPRITTFVQRLAPLVKEVRGRPVDLANLERDVRLWRRHGALPPEYRAAAAEVLGVEAHVIDEAIGDNRAEVRSQLIFPQKVSWGPANGLPAGIQVWSIEGEFSMRNEFVPWRDLESEITRILLPWVLTKAENYRLVTQDFRDKIDWLVWLVNPLNEWFCDVWLGGDPDRNWDFDGLTRFGDANSTPRAWITFQRYSDGSYRKLHSIGDTLDQIKASKQQHP